jgi:hypothetical protein
METGIEIEILKKGTVKVVLDDRNPSTAQKLYENLPLEGAAQLWLEEFSSPYPWTRVRESLPLIR